MKTRRVTMLGCCVASLALAALNARGQTPQYICIPDKSVGFRYDEVSKTWATTTFATPEKYVLRKLDQSDLKNYSPLLKGNTYGFFQVGSEMPLAACNDDFIMGLECSPVTERVDFDHTSRRFQIYARGNYVDQWVWDSTPPDKKGRFPDDVFVEMGTCTEF